jgi:flagellar biosynthesis protein
MARSTEDKGKSSEDDGVRDEVGPRQPRWAEPRPKSSIAVALDYKQADGKVDPKRAPRVAASGRGAVAEQILQIAFAKGIPVREDADLAQILATLDVDSVIPVDALSAVAEILSYLYRMNGKAMDGEPAPDGDTIDTGGVDTGMDEAGDRR